MAPERASCPHCDPFRDTSCLIKLYTPEPDSCCFRNHLAAMTTCITCDLTPLEFRATVRPKESEGVLAPGDAIVVFLQPPVPDRPA